MILEGAELIHAYTSGKLVFQSALAGDAIAGGSYVDFVIPDVTAPPDSVWYNTARLDGSGAGPGIIAFYTFQAPQEGDATITCLLADLRDSDNNQTLPECHGGVIHILGPVPAMTGEQRPAIVTQRDAEPIRAARHGTIAGTAVAVLLDVLEVRQDKVDRIAAHSRASHAIGLLFLVLSHNRFMTHPAIG